MNKKLFIAIAAVIVALLFCLLVIFLNTREVIPTDNKTARKALLQYISRKDLDIPEKEIEDVPTDGTWVSDSWVFAEKNSKYELLGGSRYNRMFLVGRGILGDEKSRYVTMDFEKAFLRIVSMRPPKNENEALKIAENYAWLALQTHPKRFVVLEDHQVPLELTEYLARTDVEYLESIKSQVAKPIISVHELKWEKKKIFTVEFCMYSPDYWGDINFWHMEIGEYFFSVSYRPIYRSLRVLE